MPGTKKTRTHTHSYTYDESKIHVVLAVGDAPPTEGRGVWRQSTRGDPYAEENKVVADLCGDTRIIGFWDPLRVCVFGILIFDTDADSYYGRHPQKIMSQNNQQKKGKYIEALLDEHRQFTPLVLSVNVLIREDTKLVTKKLATDL